ncbi:DUF3786 domain-containing protein [Metallumcola ferriviriculae]|uniref:DUF3786 domain-containing protein n=1 Tax=Metallumcola ferriviriculae TaxID=3039180 RepID=A0AAU0UNH7_9FIRM|nr:DUF3786 domain-containing protein [Desulfitibacteraceae bacterium MK1]
MTGSNLDVTLTEALTQLRKASPKDVSDRAGVEFLAEQGLFRLKYFNSGIDISYPDGKFINTELPLIERILILHYLVAASGNPIEKDYISFKELPGGEIYNTPFTNRSIRPFLQLFGSSPEEFRGAATNLGGKPETLGDVSFTFAALPRVPVTVVLWEGDEEFDASANILFNRSASGYLPTEDFAFLAGLTVSKLKSLAEAER